MNEQSAMMNQMNPQQQMMNMNQSLLSMNQMNQQQPQPQPQMIPMNRSYGIWGQQQFQNPNLNSGAMKPPTSAFNKSLGPRSNWKGKRVSNPADKRRMEQQQSSFSGGGGGGGNLNLRNYNPPTLNELQDQNRLKARKFFPKRKFNKNKGMNMNMNMNMNMDMGGRSAPFAPRNTTSFLIRAKKSGGIAPLVSPYPVTPSVLPTPILSPSTEVLGDMAKEEWGVDGYGSMKGLIRLRSHGNEMEANEDEEEDESSDVEVERRLDHDLSRFEMIYDPNSVNVGGMDYHNLLENRVDDQDTHIAQLEDENLILKERLFLMERELEDLRRRLVSLERTEIQDEDANEEVVEDESENENESESQSHGVESHLADEFEAAESMEEKFQNEDEGIINMADIHDNDNTNDKESNEESSNNVNDSTGASEKFDEMAENEKHVKNVVDAECDKHECDVGREK